MKFSSAGCHFFHSIFLHSSFFFTLFPYLIRKKFTYIPLSIIITSFLCYPPFFLLYYFILQHLLHRWNWLVWIFVRMGLSFGGHFGRQSVPSSSFFKSWPFCFKLLLVFFQKKKYPKPPGYPSEWVLTFHYNSKYIFFSASEWFKGKHLHEDIYSTTRKDEAYSMNFDEIQSM